jgi:ubiquinone/menaquinone biosynthesis C-methylase UbiE
MHNGKYQEVVAANIALHGRMSEAYSTCEPHFRPENVRAVEAKLLPLLKATNAQRLLDLGCGTGFMIDIAKHHVREIYGVDVTRAMLDKVDTTGPCVIQLFEADAGNFLVTAETFDVVTSYSFLHHLYDIKPAIETAYRALRPGGRFYADLDPNYYFWAGINGLERAGDYDLIVRREIEAVTFKDEDIERTFGVPKAVFNDAEYGKNVLGGFREEELHQMLVGVGFGTVKFMYHWFIGQAGLINDQGYSVEERFRYAEIMDMMLQKALPLSKSLFKYLGFVATK